MNCRISGYEYDGNDMRMMVEVVEGWVFIAYITGFSSAIAIRMLKKGEVWHEGPDELIGVYATMKSAEKAADVYFLSKYTKRR